MSGLSDEPLMDSKYKLKNYCVWACIALGSASPLQAQTQASVPYSPSWQVRHHLQWLSDHAGLQLTTSHWPLPMAAVEQAMSHLSRSQPDQIAQQVAWSRSEVLRELNDRQEAWRLRAQVRSRSDALNGFDDNYTPGSSVQVESEAWRFGSPTQKLTGALRLGGRAEVSPNSLQTQFSGHGAEGLVQFRPDGSAAVLGFDGWNVQAFSQRYWWGPGWQSSLINGHNNPSWTGVGLQRGIGSESESAWLSWMGPWNLDVFFAKAQDPQVVTQQPSGFLFSGMRLTMKPKPWLELGFSRGVQTAGAGRPSGAANLVKAILGQQLNKRVQDTFVDSSSQIAGYDARLTCPESWGGWLGSCAAYTQWMGEDAVGKVPLPYKFMSMWGFESTLREGRHRVFVEWTNTNDYSLPWDTKQSYPGYLNSVYLQGYTQGARWVGSAQGSGSKVMTLGWMDAENLRVFKLHTGQIQTSLGAYDPRVTAPHGRLFSMSAAQTLDFKSMNLTPEVAYTRLSQGIDQGANLRKDLRISVMMDVKF
ncbi:MAG: hypothetical protein CFE38_14145 [Comamonadaceae bacterium PBBC1]|nr:MAG: hypothetical protein CFE38_14145 [Comamonadaceae bacterium PBBC1]